MGIFFSHFNSAVHCGAPPAAPPGGGGLDWRSSEDPDTFGTEVKYECGAYRVFRVKTNEKNNI